MNARDAVKATYMLAIGGAAAALAVLIVGASTIAALGHEVPKELWAIGAALTGAIVGILAPSPRGRREASPLAAAEATARAASLAAKENAKNHPCEPAATEAVGHVDKAGQKAVRELKAAIDASESPSSAGAMAAAARIAQALEDEHRKAKEAADEATSAAKNAAAEAKTAAADGAADAAEKAANKDAAEAKSARAQTELSVHSAAEEAATKAAGTASTVEQEAPLGLKGIFTEPKIIVPLVLFVAALTLALLLGLGVIHTGVKVCRLKKDTIHSCEYYAKVTHQIATVLISIASAAAGALIGIFAKSPVEAAEQSGAAK